MQMPNICVVWQMCCDWVFLAFCIKSVHYKCRKKEKNNIVGQVYFPNKSWHSNQNDCCLVQLFLCLKKNNNQRMGKLPTFLNICLQFSTARFCHFKVLFFFVIATRITRQMRSLQMDNKTENIKHIEVHSSKQQSIKLKTHLQLSMYIDLSPIH